jgi:hypothetical protein
VSALPLTAATRAKLERFKLARAAHFEHGSASFFAASTELAYDDAARDLAYAIVLDDEAGQ